MKKRIIGLFFIFVITFFITCKWGIKDQEPPQILFTQSNLFISPNGDGIQDTVDFDISIKEQNFISYWKMEIYNDKKEVVKIFESDEKLEEQMKKLVLPNKNITIPRKITWDGKDNKGNSLPDGKYTFKFILMDNKKNITKLDSDSGMIIIDTEKPEAKLTITDTIYSPNNDGNKDKIQIKVNIIKDKAEPILVLNTNIPSLKDGKGDSQLWYLEVIDEKGNIVKRFEFKERGNYEIEWDFKNEKGEVVPDGIYKLKLKSTDLAGNSFEEIQGTITVDTKDTPVKIIAKESYFSPNGDNIKEAQTFEIETTITDGIESWEVTVFDSNDKSIYSVSGKTKIEQKIVWNGRDLNGKIANDGKYYAAISVKYINGNNPVAKTSNFFIDNTPPTATITLTPDVFSPDGNGKQDELFIRQKTSEEDIWEGLIFDEKGNLVKKFIWSISPKAEEIWDGKDNDNKLLPDGIYYYQLVATDRAGNKFESRKYQTKIYTKDTPVFITASLPSFSPNGDNIKDKQIFEIKINKEALETQIVEWKLEIKDKSNNIIFSSNQKSDVPQTLEWDGKDSSGKVSKDEQYVATLTTVFKAGTISTSNSKPFIIDTQPPVAKVTHKPKYFSPDGDGENEEVTISIEATDPSGINSWKLLILSPNKKKEFFSFEGVGTPAKDIVWDGKNANQDTVESVEDYPVKLIVEDTVGNRLEKEFAPIQVDILVIKLPDGRLKIRISNITFKADQAIMEETDKNREILDLLINSLKKYPQHKIIIEGHANKFSRTANETVGKRLSQQRAERIALELTKRGIAKERITAIGKGFDEPIIPFRDDMTKEEIEELAINRRVEFYLVR